MATLTIAPTHVASYEVAIPINGTGATVLGDGNNTTGWQNYYGTFPATIRVYSTATMPAAFVGATINSVGVTRVISSNLQKGEAHITLYRDVYTLDSATLGPGFTPGTTTFSRPGGGSWVYTDFYQGSLQWQWAWHGNADDPSKTSLLEEFYLTIDYTPVSTPTAQFTVSTTTGTAPLTVNFTDQSTGSPTSWGWDFGDSGTSALQNPTHVYTTSATSTYTVTLTATNASGTDSEVKSSLITVDPYIAAAVAEFVALPVSGVQNLTVRFSDQSTGSPAINTWLWNFGDSATSTAQHPIHTYTTIGTYTVTLTVENTTPTTDTETKASYITVADGRPVPAVTVSTTVGTRPLEVDFTAVATNALPIKWVWDFGDGNASFAQNPTHVYNTVGTYSPVLSVENAIGTNTTDVMTLAGTVDTYTQLVVNFATITASFTVQPQMGYIPLTVRFKDQSQGDAASWAWDFGDSTLGYSQYPSHTYFDPDFYTVIETAYSDDPELLSHLTNYWEFEESSGSGDRVDFIGSVDLTPSNAGTQITGKHLFANQLALGDSFANTTGIDWVEAYTLNGWFQWSQGAETDITFFKAIDGVTVNPKLGLLDEFLTLTVPGGPTYTGTTLLAVNTWYFLTLWFDGVNTYRVYLNTELELEATTNTLSDDTGIQIGPSVGVGEAGGGTLSVDEASRYNIAINEVQLRGLYYQGEGNFFNQLRTSDTVTFDYAVCPIHPDNTWGYFFEEAKYMLMEPMFDQDVCEGFEAFGGIFKAVELTQKRLQRFVLETAALRKEATLSAATADTEDFALPTDLIELLRVEVDGDPYYNADKFQVDMDSEGVNLYYQKDSLAITIPGTFGTTPTVKVLYTYVPAAPTVPAPCTCPAYPATGPWVAFPIPYVLWWVIRYGLMADMFSQAGERNDPLRAAKCEEMYAFGTQLYKTLYRGGSL